VLQAGRSDQILGRDNPWSDLYHAKRFSLAKSAGAFVHEILDGAKRYLRDHLADADAPQTSGTGAWHRQHGGNQGVEACRLSRRVRPLTFNHTGLTVRCFP
jgi:hypothetical protein